MDPRLFWTEFRIQRGTEDGGDVEYATYEDMEKDFSDCKLHPGDLKGAVEVRLNALLDPVRKIFEDPALVKLVQAAYPPPKKASVADSDVVAPHRLDIRVGKIVQVDKHPEAEHLYVEKIDLGKFFFFTKFLSCQLFRTIAFWVQVSLWARGPS